MGDQQTAGQQPAVPTKSDHCRWRTVSEMVVVAMKVAAAVAALVGALKGSGLL
jgi:hypothetical protein